jgi:hypothetical protein
MAHPAVFERNVSQWMSLSPYLIDVIVISING